MHTYTQVRDCDTALHTLCTMRKSNYLFLFAPISTDVLAGVDGLETEQFELRNMMVISTKWTDLSPSFYSHFKPKVIEAMGSDFDAQNLEQFTTVSASEEQGDSGLSIGFSFGPNGIEYLSVYLNTQVPVSGFQFSFTDQHGEPLAVQNGFGGLCQEKNIWVRKKFFFVTYTFKRCIYIYKSS